MNSVARLASEERRLLFDQTAAATGLAPWVVEKDFWVCWILRELFSGVGDSPRLLFKGGTSLSKVFGLIHRFSEDIDLSVNRQDLGFIEERDPESVTGNARKRLLDELDEQVRKHVREEIVPRLRSVCGETLLAEDDWGISEESETADFTFRYPTEVRSGITGYASQAVLVECGGRSDHEPAGDYTITPYAHDHFPDYFDAAETTISVMSPERTFWEKATILHAHHHGGREKAGRRERLSRHYYDLYQLAESRVGPDATSNLDLLERVRIHKTVYFASAWARYDLARPGSLRLCPRADTVELVARDYDEMVRAGYFFEGHDPPPFTEILGRLAHLEGEINGGLGGLGAP